MCDIEISRMRMPWPALGRSSTKNYGTHPASCFIDIGSYFYRHMEPEAGHSPPPRYEVKNSLNYNPTSLCAFIVSCLITYIYFSFFPPLTSKWTEHCPFWVADSCIPCQKNLLPFMKHKIHHCTPKSLNQESETNPGYISHYNLSSILISSSHQVTDLWSWLFHLWDRVWGGGSVTPCSLVGEYQIWVEHCFQSTK
jgi:hypothetical protein